MYTKTDYLEWGTLAVSIVSMVVAAYNIYPLYVYTTLVSSTGWLLLGVVWRKRSLVIIQLLVNVIYAAGLIHYWRT